MRFAEWLCIVASGVHLGGVAILLWFHHPVPAVCALIVAVAWGMMSRWIGCLVGTCRRRTRTGPYRLR